ncbi:integrase catalytic domain-containing protein [Trichonephila clavipes]|nr:integrase catalytic domain-containing protein [Trichonephila clavipes]
MLRFVHNIRNRFNKQSDDLSTEEIDGAENFWIQLVQRDAFAEEVNCLRARKLLLKTSVILEFNPSLDLDLLIRFGGRLQKSKFSYLQKHPIILPAKHYFVNLMVRDSREKVFHGGVSETLLEIRERFWLIKGRQTVLSFRQESLVNTSKQFFFFLKLTRISLAVFKVFLTVLINNVWNIKKTNNGRSKILLDISREFILNFGMIANYLKSLTKKVRNYSLGCSMRLDKRRFKNFTT